MPCSYLSLKRVGTWLFFVCCRFIFLIFISFCVCPFIFLCFFLFVYIYFTIFAKINTKTCDG